MEVCKCACCVCLEKEGRRDNVTRTMQQKYYKWYILCDQLLKKVKKVKEVKVKSGKVMAVFLTRSATDRAGPGWALGWFECCNWPRTPPCWWRCQCGWRGTKHQCRRWLCLAYEDHSISRYEGQLRQRERKCEKGEEEGKVVKSAFIQIWVQSMTSSECDNKLSLLCLLLSPLTSLKAHNTWIRLPGI